MALLVVSAIPLVLLTTLGVYALRYSRPVQEDAGIAAVARTAPPMFAVLEGTALPDSVRTVVDRNRAADSTLLQNAPAAPYLQNRASAAGAAAVIAAAILSLVAAILLGSTLARQYSAPLDEVVDWTNRIRQHDPLPEPTEHAIPEFAVLQAALRDLQHDLEQARAVELEAERLRAFGEVARRVAHEMKNPLTPIRLALSQMARRAPPEFRDELDVIAVESARLESMAREFAELGRLPEGVAAPVDLGELLDDLLRSTVPAAMTRNFRPAPDVATIVGYYDPLRRAFSNIVRNAVEACHGQGAIDVQLRQIDGRVEVAVSDNGPGIPPERRELIFQPYYTEKGDGTGLGLTIVRQTIEQHGGTIAVTETPGGGATFVVRLPAQRPEGRA